MLQFTREMRANVAPMDLSAAVEQAVEFASKVATDLGVRCDVDGPESTLVLGMTR